MEISRLKFLFTICILAFSMSFGCLAQSYRKDSLQIKAYTLIKYENNQVKDIELIKVLCDYCTDLQKKAIGEEALRRSFLDRYSDENRMTNGQKKLAIFIRVAKRDLAAIKEEEKVNN